MWAIATSSDLEAIVLASRASSWDRKSSDRPGDSSSSSRSNWATWLSSRTSSSAMSDRSAIRATSRIKSVAESVAPDPSRSLATRSVSRARCSTSTAGTRSRIAAIDCLISPQPFRMSRASASPSARRMPSSPSRAASRARATSGQLCSTASLEGGVSTRMPGSARIPSIVRGAGMRCVAQKSSRSSR